MKKILITGANSYVGTNVEKWLMKEPDKYYVETLDMKDPNWKDFDFSKFDVVFHVAGFAHAKETRKNRDLYYKINRDLSNDLAMVCKKNNIEHFIFMSSMSVYGIESGVIDSESIPNPKSAYGKSKFEAEQFILNLKDNDFRISIVRPPMIYGESCKGNYQKLKKLAQRLPVFPNINNSRSMIYIDNFSEFIKIIIDKKMDGIFLPQNSEYVNTTQLAKALAFLNNKDLITTTIFNFIINIFMFGRVKKLFGSLIYDKKASLLNLKYNIFSFEESIVNKKSESAKL